MNAVTITGDALGVFKGTTSIDTLRADVYDDISDARHYVAEGWYGGDEAKLHLSKMAADVASVCFDCADALNQAAADID